MTGHELMREEIKDIAFVCKNPRCENCGKATLLYPSWTQPDNKMVTVCCKSTEFKREVPSGAKC